MEAYKGTRQYALTDKDVTHAMTCGVMAIRWLAPEGPSAQQIAIVAMIKRLLTQRNEHRGVEP